MKMPRHKRWLDFRPAQLPPHESRRRTFPDCVLDVYDRRHQRDETKIALDHCKECANPSPVTRSKYAKLATTALAQRHHQLPHLDHALAQALGITDEVGRNREFAVPVAARHTRIVIGEVHETSVPAEFVEVRSAAAIANMTRGHERVHHEHRWRAPAARA